MVLFLLCMQILSGNAFASEMAKLPFLIQHYFEHGQEEHPGLSFSDYLWEHYVAKSHDHKEKKHCDDKLPFKHCHDCCSHMAPLLILTLPEKSVMLPVLSFESTHVFEHTNNFISSHYDHIWQPPKLIHEVTI
jgi:hypothetical protein